MAATAKIAFGIEWRNRPAIGHGGFAAVHSRWRADVRDAAGVVGRRVVGRRVVGRRGLGRGAVSSRGPDLDGDRVVGPHAIRRHTCVIGLAGFDAVLRASKKERAREQRTAPDCAIDGAFHDARERRIAAERGGRRTGNQIGDGRPLPSSTGRSPRSPSVRANATMKCTASSHAM